MLRDELVVHEQYNVQCEVSESSRIISNACIAVTASASKVQLLQLGIGKD